MPENRIILHTPESLHKHVRVTADNLYLLVEYGHYKNSIFTPQKIETLYYNENEELADIWNRGAWDLVGLHALLINPDARDVTIPLPWEFSENVWGGL